MQKDIQELIIRANREKALDSFVFESLKKEMAKKYKTKTYSNILILAVYRNLIKNKKIKQNKSLEELLKKQKIRTSSGIASIAVFTRPYKCPGKCLYCPSQRKMPKSYLDDEPAVMRAVLCNYSPKKQIETRLHALDICGHPTDKIELIIMGGTFSSLPLSYQTNFVINCFKAANEFNTKISNSKLKIKNELKIDQHRSKFDKKSRSGRLWGKFRAVLGRLQRSKASGKPSWTSSRHLGGVSGGFKPRKVANMGPTWRPKRSQNQ